MIIDQKPLLKRIVPLIKKFSIGNNYQPLELNRLTRKSVKIIIYISVNNHSYCGVFVCNFGMKFKLKKMKHFNKMRFFLALSTLLFVSQSFAQCTITGLDAEYCANDDVVTLTGTPSGGVFTGPGMSGSNFDPAIATEGTHEISYSYTYERDIYYVKGQVGNPWGNTSNQTAMDLAFGSGNWFLAAFETLDPSVVFSYNTAFVFMDGSDEQASELSDFLTANLSLIESWVADGGRLLINSASNEEEDISFGFGGTTMVDDFPSSSVTVVDLTFPAFTGPNLPTAATMTGGNYAHGRITGVGYTTVLHKTGDASTVVLAEKNWGNGRVMVGSMSTVNFHSPSPASQNWRANLLAYMYESSTRYYVSSSAAGEPWGSTSNATRMNEAFGTHAWTKEYFESLNVLKVFSRNTSFVFMDGSDEGANPLSTFLAANMTAIEEWVNKGGSLFINAAPNYGGDINFGFDGTDLHYETPASMVDVIDLSHPAFLGPLGPIASTMTGSSYSHAHITGTGLTNILQKSDEGSIIILAEKDFGEGTVMFGGMTTSNYHGPSPQAQKWRANLFSYLDNEFDGYTCSATESVIVNPAVEMTFTTTEEIAGSDGEIDMTITSGSSPYSIDWDNDGTGDFDDSEDLTGLTGGMYTVVIVDSKDCEATETVTVNSQVSIDEFTNRLIKIYPNPTQANITVELKGYFTYKLLNFNGQVLFNGQGTDKKVVSLEDFANGIYFIRIQSNKTVQTVKIAKK